MEVSEVAAHKAAGNIRGETLEDRELQKVSPKI